MPSGRLRAQAAGILLIGLSPLWAQQKLVQFGQLTMNSEHKIWPSPESIVRDLRSSNADARAKALASVGVPEALRVRSISWNYKDKSSVNVVRTGPN